MKAVQRSFLLAAALAAAPLVPDVSAQTSVPWNRQARTVALVPSPSGIAGHFDISLVWIVMLGQPASAPLKLDTDVAFAINGIEVFRLTDKVQANPLAGNCGSCAPGCGSGATNGIAASLICLSDGSAGCSCQFPPFTGTFPDVPLQPGDEISVILSPAPGALPDFQTTDDIARASFSGGPIYWDRHAQGAHLVPTAGGGPDTWDLVFEWGATTAGTTDTQIITPEFEVHVNGAKEFAYESPCGPWILAPSASCFSCTGQVCATITCGGVVQSVSTCQEDAQGVYCVCSSSTSCQVVIPGLVLAPGDEVEVLLKASPGALPELPGLEGDESAGTTLPWDPWKDLGKALAGKNGEPTLVGAGTLEGGTPLSLSLAGAHKLAPSWLVAGPVALFAPFKGGVLVPSPAPPALLLPQLTSALGTQNLVGVWPFGIPGGFTMYFQYWIADAGGPQGFAASNALSATTEP